MNSKTKLIIAGLAVAALGSITAGLFATDKGRRTKRDLRKKARKIRNKTLQQVGELKVGVGRKYDHVKEAATHVIDEGLEKVSSISGKAK